MPTDDSPNQPSTRDRLPATIRVDGPHGATDPAATAPAPLALPAIAGDAADLVASFLEGLAPQTRDAYGRDLDDFATFVNLGNRAVTVAALLASDAGAANGWVHRYRSDMANRGLAASTIKRRLSAIKSVVKFARLLGRVAWTVEVVPPKVVPYRDTRGPGADGWAKLLEAAMARPDSPIARRDVALIRLMHDRGLRRGEALGLDLAHVDLAAGTISIRGKGRSARETLTVGPKVVEALSRWIASRGPTPGPLFVRLDPGQDAPDEGSDGRLTGYSVARIVAGLSKRAGLDRVARPHGLRHSSITEALDRGHDVRAVARFSRHKSLDILMVYDDNRRDLGGEIAKELEG